MVRKRNTMLWFALCVFCALLLGCQPPSAPEITTSSPLPDAKVGRPYSASLKARGGERPFIWSGNPPEGLKLDRESGQITGSPDREGTFPFEVIVKDSRPPGRSTSKMFKLTVSPNVPLAISTASPLPSAGINQPYSTTIEVRGAEGKLNWSSTNLTDDFTLDQGSGAIEGTPERTGTFTFDVMVKDGTKQCATKRFVLGVLAILTDTLHQATEGQEYAPVTLQAAGGNPPLKWSGTLPANLILNPETGEIGGTPAAAGEFDVDVTGTDSSTPTRSVSKTFQLTVKPQDGGGCESHTVVMDNFQFDPANLTVRACDKVTWMHNQAAPQGVEHTVTSDSGIFDSRGNNPAARMLLGQSFSHTFAAPGTFPYHCVVHGAPGGGGMSGTITAR